MTKENDKDSDQINDEQDSGGNSAQTTGQEKPNKKVTRVKKQ